MTTTNLTSSKEGLPAGKAGKVIYWIATIWLALGMASSGVVQLLKVEAEIDFILKLGYPFYFLTLISIWKIVGVITILIPKFPLLKEWAYAGFFFLMSGALFSHIAAGNVVQEMFPPILLIVLTVVFWYFRPLDRKII